MLFGSEEMKQLLLESVADSKNGDVVLEVLQDVVFAYVEKKLRSGSVSRPSKTDKTKTESVYTTKIPICDYDIIKNSVYCEVYMSLDKFIISLQKDNYTEAQRQSWLRTITLRTIADYFDDKKKEQAISLEQDVGKEVADPRQAIPERRTEDVLKIIRLVNAKASKAEIKLAYLLNYLVYYIDYARRKSSVPTITAQGMHGKSLFELTEELIFHIERIYKFKVDQKDISSLLGAFAENGKPTEYGKKICSAEGGSNEVCQITPKDIANWTNRINTYLYKKKMQSLRKEEDTYAGN